MGIAWYTAIKCPRLKCVKVTEPPLWPETKLPFKILFILFIRLFVRDRKTLTEADVLHTNMTYFRLAIPPIFSQMSMYDTWHILTETCDVMLTLKPSDNLQGWKMMKF